jgi:uncharacterized protein (DUF305 family)
VKNRRIPPFLAVAAALLLLAGCGEGGDQDAGAVAMDTTVAAAGPEGIAVSSNVLEAGSPDHRFFQQMSDHHVGLVQMSQQAQQKATQDTVKTEARHFLAGHTNDLEQMQRMLQEHFNDRHQPTIMPRHAAMVDSLSQQQGAQFNRAYVQDVIEHHQGGVRMIEVYLPSATQENVKVLAAKMKTVQTEDIKRLEGLLARL